MGRFVVLRCASLFSYEIDDPQLALDEVLSQLNEEIELLDNTVGIIMCNPEFIETGTLEYLCEHLPFEVAGVTTSCQAVNGEVGELVLTIFVMTSDDVQFRTGLTESVIEETGKPTAAAFEAATAGQDTMPKLALIFPPRIVEIAGDVHIHEAERVIPGVPIFGAMATDDTVTFESSAAIFNGRHYKDRMPFILCYGEINPRFLIGTFPEDKAMPYKGEVTSASGSYVREINNINAYQYFEEIGFAANGARAEKYLFVPFLIDLKTREDSDGVPVTRTLASFTEEGTAIFRGYVDEGSTFSLLTGEPEDVMAITQMRVEEAVAVPDINGLLLFPCIVRQMITMQINPLRELEIARDIIPPNIPFMMGYAAGEICPTSVRNGVPANRFHNYSLVILAV